MTEAIVHPKIATMRTKPAPTSEIADEVLSGMVIEILEDAGEWCYIRTHYRYEGYVLRSSLKDIPVGWKGNKVVKARFVDVLAEPRIQSYCLATLPRGGIVTGCGVESLDGQWSQVILASGEKGWIRRSHLMDVQGICQSEDVFREYVVKTAMSYMDSQYRWGGKTPEGIDCSGLTSMAYLLNGVIIFRDADIEEGFPVRKIPASNVQKGDLLYTPGHIMLYIGNGKYIHSSLLGDGVKINSLHKQDTDYRADLAQSLLFGGTIF